VHFLEKDSVPTQVHTNGVCFNQDMLVGDIYPEILPVIKQARYLFVVDCLDYKVQTRTTMEASAAFPRITVEIEFVQFDGDLSAGSYGFLISYIVFHCRCFCIKKTRARLVRAAY
jgi:hypothetical protein